MSKKYTLFFALLFVVNQLFGQCPQPKFTKPATSTAGSTLAVINTAETGVVYNWDFCAGDLAQLPTAQNLNMPFTNQTVVEMANDNGKWYGFVPNVETTPANGGNTLLRLDFGNNVASEPLQIPLGNPQGALNRPANIKLYKEGNIWFGLVLNQGNNTLSRLRFGRSLDSIPAVSTVTLPNNTLNNPYGLELVKDCDTLYALITNESTTLTNRNFIRLRFGASIQNTPTVNVLDNPIVMQNAGGLTGLSAIKVCNEWYVLATSLSGQVYKLSFGASLNNNPIVGNITPAISAQIPATALVQARNVSLQYELGRVYAFINSFSGNVVRLAFGTGIQNLPTEITNLGDLGILRNLSGLTFVKQQSEWFAFGTDRAARTLLRLKFPNNCAAANPVRTSVQPGGVTYTQAGKYYISVQANKGCEQVSVAVDSVIVTGLPLPLVCPTGASVTAPSAVCLNLPASFSANIAAAKNYTWDFCAGDLNATPTAIQAGTLPAGNPTGISLVFDGKNYRGISISNQDNKLIRLNFGVSLNNPTPDVTDLGNLGFTTAGAFGVKVVKEGNQWIGLITNSTSNNLTRIVLDSSFNIVRTSTIAGGQLNRPRGIDIFQDRGEYFAVVNNQTTAAVTVFRFGNSLLNTPQADQYNIPQAVAPYDISMIKDCNQWYGIIADNSVGTTLFKINFNQGLYNAPIISRLDSSGRAYIARPSGVKLVRENGEYYAFVSTSEAPNHFFRINFGTSMANPSSTPINLGNLTLLNNMVGFDMIQQRNSEWIAYGTSSDANRRFYRITFPNNCAANQPVVTTGAPANIIFNRPGTFRYSLTATDNNDNVVVIRDSIVVRNPVTANFTFDGLSCKNQPIAFKNTTVLNTSSLVSYSWNFADPTSGAANTTNQENPTRAFAAPGTYNVSFTVRDNESGCTNTAVKPVVIRPKPRPDFSFNAALCSNDSISFKDLTVATNDTIRSWSWSVRDNTSNLLATSITRNPKFFFANAGSYTVTLIVTGRSGCDTSVTKPVSIALQGTPADFDVQKSCQGEAVTLNSVNQGSNLTYAWNLGNGNTSTLPQPTVVYNGIGPFNVSLTVKNDQGCQTTVTKQLRLSRKPVAKIVANNSPCALSPVEFGLQNVQSEGNIVTQTWDFGDGSPISNNPVHIFPQFGNYTVKVTFATEFGCTGSDSLRLFIKPGPTADFSFNETCFGRPVSFKDQSNANNIPGGISAGSYVWELEKGELTSTVNPEYTYSKPGIYDVRLTVSAGGCSNTVIKQVKVSAQPEPRYAVEEGCIGSPFIFKDQTKIPGSSDTVSIWDWSFTNGRSSTEKNPRILVDAPGLLGITLTVTTESGCTGTATGVLTVGTPPVAQFRVLDSVFVQAPYRVRFRNQSTNAIRYRWDFGDGRDTVTTNGDFVHNYQQEGVYSVTLTAYRSNICSTMVTRVVNLIKRPTLDIRIASLAVLKNKLNNTDTVVVELENKSNVELRALDLTLEIGGGSTIIERWTGSLLPPDINDRKRNRQFYKFKSVLANAASAIPFVCVMASHPQGQTDITIDDNRKCAAVRDSSFASINVSPNPVFPAQMVRLTYMLPKTGQTTVRIVDMLGRELAVLANEQQTAGVYEINYNPGKLSAGVYIVQFIHDGKAGNRRFIKAQ